MKIHLAAAVGSVVLTAGAVLGAPAAGAQTATAYTTADNTRHGQMGPATEEAQCRTTYKSGGWNVTPCIYLGTGTTFDGWSFVDAHPSSCATYRVYLVDAATGALVQSTSARPCSETLSPDVFADASKFTRLSAYTKFRAFNSSGGVILSLDSPSITWP
ncbi:hypothetical protein ABZ341_31650 [Streptomyces sp. NPDC006173]|uniref:hypothetical protein n=1 Tax=Streptomyces sp. NPDC006173 TaxID=3155349 RepID=UPI0033ECC143